MNSLLNVLHKESQDDNSDDEQRSIITDLFQIQIESQVTCTTCDTCDSNKEANYCLPLPLADQPTDTLDELLADFLKENMLSGSYHCSVCQTLRTAKQKTTICSPLPPVIIVQLKRFTFDDSDDKLKTFVQYPVTDWNLMCTPNGEQYNLVSVVIHVGNLKNGHYTTFARLNGDGLWYNFDDEYVEPVSNREEIVNQNAYVLVYLKK
jgi:ubiquitin C-terminal hydrolase